MSLQVADSRKDKELAIVRVDNKFHDAESVGMPAEGSFHDADGVDRNGEDKFHDARGVEKRAARLGNRSAARRRGATLVETGAATLGQSADALGDRAGKVEIRFNAFPIRAGTHAVSADEEEIRGAVFRADAVTGARNAADVES